MNSLIISMVLSVIGSVWGALRVRSKRAQKIDQALQRWVPIAYDVVNDIFMQNKNEYADRTNKTTTFVDELTRLLATQGIKMTPELTRQAVAMADAMHYRDKRKEKILLGPITSSQLTDMSQPSGTGTK